MHTLNLIDPQRSAIKFEAITFPDGQPHIKLDMASLNLLDKKEPLIMLTRLRNPQDLMLLLFAKNALDYLELEHIELYVSYLMAARMDRVMLDGEPFSLKVVADVINQANFKKIKIFDPHSEVSTALIHRSYAITNHVFVQHVLDHYFENHDPTSFSLVSPDAGALKKIHKLAQFLNIYNVVECMKERDLKTGHLSNFKTTTDDLSGQTCFIVDDICDGGGTFAGTAKVLKEKGASKVILIVSHGIFSKGTVIEGVDEIYTTNSYRKLEHVHCFDINPLLV